MVTPQQWYGKTTVRADNNNRGVFPLVIEERSNLADNNTHRHQGNNPAVPQKDGRKSIGGVIEEICMQECSYLLCFHARIRERDNNGFLHE